ncbi:hypothetical protein L2E82_43356 [Cichorium intybus]|uniref:Uncharacterized protein n=1 Tax=Cichorium intybus TaxID=13427 RepID=A0ACB8ZNP7_CICIN|nr:hypothetical protein L2E82_43356 [Cichorium intybus]
MDVRPEKLVAGEEGLPGSWVGDADTKNGWECACVDWKRKRSPKQKPSMEKLGAIGYTPITCKSVFLTAGNRDASKGGRRSRVVNQGRDTPDVGEEVEPVDQFDF